MFFIFGSPRSGTTLLAQCLNAHSEIVVPHETDFIVPMMLIFARIKDPEKGRSMIAEIVTDSAYANSLIEFLTRDALRDLVYSSEYHPADILESIYQAIARVMKKRIAGDKSPNDLGYLSRMANRGLWRAETKMIHIVRDVRDVMASLYETKWVDPSAVLFPRLWCHDNLYLHLLFQNKTDRYFFIRYEDMVKEPESVFRQICGFLEVKFEKDMLVPENRHPRYKKMAHHNNLFRAVSDERIGRYQQHLTAEQVSFCEIHAREGLERFNYSR